MKRNEGFHIQALTLLQFESDKCSGLKARKILLLKDIYGKKMGWGEG